MTTATTETLTFEDVPTGTLYVLHDMAEGTEERIFTFDENNNIYRY